MKNKNMKTKSFTKIFAAVFALVLLVGACFALCVSAEDTTTLEIKAKNVNIGSEYTVMFAAESSDDNAEIELLYYLEDPSLNADATAYKAVKAESAAYAHAFYTHGVPVQDIADEIWAKAHIVDTEVYSDVVKYSVAEYIFARLYKHDIINATEEKDLVEKAFLESFVEFASNAQAHLEKESETLAKNYYYAYVQDGVLNGGDSSELFDPANASVTLTYTGTSSISGWSVTTYTAEGSSTKEIGVDEGVTLTGHTIITPVEGIATLTEGETFDNLTTLKGDGSDSDVLFGTGSYQTSDANGQVVSGDEIKIVKDPTGADNNVLMFKDGSTSGYSSIWLPVKGENGKATNGISIFETKIYVPKSEILSTGNVLAQPQYGASSGGKLHYENLLIAGDKSYLYFELDNKEGAETEGNITTDAWHTLRLEFYNYASGAGAPIVKVYIDNLYAGYTDVTTVKDTTGFRWAGFAGAKFTIYFDNMSMIEKAMPTE